jgi:hypothetical protein
MELVPKKLAEVSIAAGTFATFIKNESDERMTFDYPKVGRKYDLATETWQESPFPATPRGFSGGACFGVVRIPAAPIAQVQYKLLAIQYAWDKTSSVFAVPIQRWCELLQQNGVC